MDIRLKQLSYSSVLTLHSCPRQYQLYKLNTQVEVKKDEENADEQLTFQFGHSVGDGIARLLKGDSLPTVIWHTFLEWKCDFLSEDNRRGKSFWQVVIALQKFHALREAGFLKEYELVYYGDSSPAIELGFIIELPGGFRYRGFVDVVLRNRQTGRVLVLEIKTSSGQVIANSYKNSSQAIGYSVVLDVLFPDLSSYEVLYLVYKTKEREYEPISYPKSYLQRAQWIQELLLETQRLQMYENVGVYPMHGESCVSKFYRECKYLGVCTLSTEKISKALDVEAVEKLKEDDKKYAFRLSLEQLIEAQLSKAGIETNGEDNDRSDSERTESTYVPRGTDHIL